jgi:hypothetical protein
MAAQKAFAQNGAAGFEGKRDACWKLLCEMRSALHAAA